MKKIDLKKELNHLYNPSAKKMVTVKVPKFNFLMIDGRAIRIIPKDLWKLLRLFIISPTRLNSCSSLKKELIIRLWCWRDCGGRV